MDERYLRWVMVTSAVLGVIATGVAAGVYKELPIILGTAAGVVIAMGNLWMLRRMGRRLVDDQAAPGKAAGMLLIKSVVLIAVIGAVILLAPINKLALMVGFSVVVAAIAATANNRFRRVKP